MKLCKQAFWFLMICLAVAGSTAVVVVMGIPAEMEIREGK